MAKAKVERNRRVQKLLKSGMSTRKVAKLERVSQKRIVEIGKGSPEDDRTGKKGWTKKKKAKK